MWQFSMVSNKILSFLVLQSSVPGISFSQQTVFSQPYLCNPLFVLCLSRLSPVHPADVLPDPPRICSSLTVLQFLWILILFYEIHIGHIFRLAGTHISLDENGGDGSY